MPLAAYQAPAEDFAGRLAVLKELRADGWSGGHESLAAKGAGQLIHPHLPRRNGRLNAGQVGAHGVRPRLGVPQRGLARRQFLSQLD